MGCGCSKKTGRRNVLVTFPDGSSKTYASAAEAQAAIVRAGGGQMREV